MGFINLDLNIIFYILEENTMMCIKFWDVLEVGKGIFQKNNVKFNVNFFFL